MRRSPWALSRRPQVHRFLLGGTFRITIAVSDVVPENKPELLKKAEADAASRIEHQFITGRIEDEDVAVTRWTCGPR